MQPYTMITTLAWGFRGCNAPLHAHTQTIQSTKRTPPTPRHIDTHAAVCICDTRQSACTVQSSDDVAAATRDTLEGYGIGGNALKVDNKNKYYKIEIKGGGGGIYYMQL